MNILMIHPHDIFSLSEPWTVRIVYLAKEFAKKGHCVKLIYFPLEWSRQKPSQLEDKIEIVPFCRRLGPHVLVHNIIRAVGLAKWADIIHFQKCFYHAAIPPITASILTGKPLHYDWDDWEVKIYEVSTKPGLLRDFIRGFLHILETTIPRISDTVSVASSRLRTECEKLNISKDKIFEAHVGADIEKFNPGISAAPIRNKYGINKPLVLYLGQLHGGQYVELYLETAAIVTHKYNKDFSFMIVGDGYRAEELKKMASDFNLDGNIIFTGAIEHDDVPQYLAAADVCVACFQENEVTSCKSPLKVVEYLSAGKAIVASSVGEVPNMLAEAGILVPSGEAQALAKGVIGVIEDIGQRRRLEKLARKRAQEKYNWTVTAGNLLEAYKFACHR